MSGLSISGRQQSPLHTHEPTFKISRRQNRVCDQPNLLNRIKLLYPSGKSILIVRNGVKPRNQKYFASQFWKSEL